MDISQLLTVGGLAGAIGGAIGTAVATLIQAWLANKARIEERKFQEKKEAYIGLLNSYYKAATNNTNEAAKEYALWQMRCELVAPENVRRTIQEIIDTNDNIQRRRVAEENLKSNMRKDLGVQK